MISTGIDGPAAGDRLAAVVAHGAHAAAGLARHDGVADVERAALDQHGRDHAAAEVDLGLDDHAAGRRVGVRLELGTSATSSSMSRKLSRPMRFLALASTKTVSPPHSSGTSSCSVSCCLIFSMLASGLSILLTTMRIGTPAALAWSMASTVCGMTPSSAATTMTAMSVTLAPRARMAVNASWPGVSRKVIVLAVVLHLVGADVLGDAAGLAGRHLGLADGVEQAGLAVVDVAHDGDDRAARLEVLGVVLDHLLDGLLLVGRVHDLDLAVEVVAEDRDRLVGEALRDGRHLAVAHEGLDDVGGRDAERLRQVLDRRAGRHLHGSAGGDRDDRRRFDALLRTAPVAPAPAVAPARPGRAPRSARVDHDAAAASAAAAPDAGAAACRTPSGRGLRRRSPRRRRRRRRPA